MATERANRVVDATDAYDRKLTALRSHRSQVGDGRPPRRAPPQLDDGHRARRRAARGPARRSVPRGEHGLVAARRTPATPAPGRSSSTWPTRARAHRRRRWPNGVRRSSWSHRPGRTAPVRGRLTGWWRMGGPMGVHDDRPGWRRNGTCCVTRSTAACPCSACAWAPSSWPRRSEPRSRRDRRRRSGPGRSSSPPTVDGTRCSAPSTRACRARPSRACTGTGTRSRLPDGAVHLAATRRFPHQAFRVGPGPTGSSSTSRSTPGSPRPGGPSCRTGVALPADGVAQVEAVGRRVLRRFVDLDRRRRAAVPV